MIPCEQKPATRRAVPRPPTGETPIQHTRIDQDDWDDLETVAGRRRAKVIRELLAWYLRRPGAALPERPSREEMTEVVRDRIMKQRPPAE
jgi:hypothetical protein